MLPPVSNYIWKGITLDGWKRLEVCSPVRTPLRACLPFPSGHWIQRVHMSATCGMWCQSFMRAVLEVSVFNTEKYDKTSVF